MSQHTSNQNHGQKRGSTIQPISWQAPEFVEYKKHPLWFIAFTLIVALVIIYGVYTKSWTMIVAFVLFGLVGLFFAAQKPKVITITLDGTGVQVGHNHIPFSEVRKFWIFYHPPVVKSLYIETEKHWNNVVKIELGEQDPIAVKYFLQKFIDEDLEARESFADALARRIKF